MRRQTLVARVVELAGPSVKLNELRSGWPSVVDVRTAAGLTRVALYVGAFSRRTYRGRDRVERRMQNPGQGHALARTRVAVPIIIGLWEEGDRPILVAFNARKRAGKATRHSMFVALPHLRVAVQRGWTSYKSSSDEEVFAFWPTMLPAYVEMVAKGVQVDPDEVAGIVEAAGLDDEGAPLPAEERVRRTTSSIVRRASFSAHVVSTYGMLCAMCGLDFGLVQGAHVYPASAPGSSDDVRNGLALCANHHGAFDRHLIYVEPESRELRLHRRLLDGAEESEGCRAFVETTLPVLREPRARRLRPRSEMFQKRYVYFEEAYQWCRASRRRSRARAA